MNKYLVIILIGLGLSSCTTKNEQYYQLHPKELQKAIAMCTNHLLPKTSLTCDQLERINNTMNGLAFQLQINPQGFGNKIIKLQQNIATQQIEINNHSTGQLKDSLEKNKLDLAYYLAVVKWLESPES